MANQKITVGISMGDINGIGPEIIIKTLHNSQLAKMYNFVVYGSTRVISYYKNAIKGVRDLKYAGLKDIESVAPNTINVWNCWTEQAKIEPGKATSAGGKFALMALDKAMRDLADRKIDCLVTAPVNKKLIAEHEEDFTGQTEHLGEFFGGKDTLMLLCGDGLRVGLVTNHVPVSQITDKISAGRIIAKIELMHATLKQDFHINKPKIAVLGLNPHCGDDGLLGNEEIDVVQPALDSVQKKGIHAYGPFPADAFFGNPNLKQYDGVLAMYHDQGLAPFKALTFGSGVNYTAGLPVVRTSPDHGTAYDIAGKDIANPDSLRAAIFQAVDMYRNRLSYHEMTANPLKKGQANKKH